MKKSLLILALSFLLGKVIGQTSADKARNTAAAQKAKEAATTSELAEQAGKTRANLDRLRKENERRLNGSQITPREHTAIKTLLEEVDKESLTEQQRQERITEFLKDASPQVKEMFLAKTEATAPTPAKPASASASGSTAKTSPPTSFANVPVPPPHDPQAKLPKKKAPSPLTIDSNDLLFRNDSKVALFRGSVRLRSLQMDIDCEELEVLFKDGAFGQEQPAPAADIPLPPGAKLKGSEEPPAFDPTKPNKAAGEGADDKKEVQSDEDKIEKAWARGKGKMITIVRRTPGKVTICKAGEAIFDSKTGNLTLKYRPEIQEGGRRIIANEPGTVFVLDKEGKLQASGPTHTAATDDQNPKSTPAPAPSPTPKPSAPPTAKPTP